MVVYRDLWGSLRWSMMVYGGLWGGLWGGLCWSMVVYGVVYDGLCSMVVNSGLWWSMVV